MNERKPPRRAPSGLADLRTRLEAAESTLRAIRDGAIDAIVVDRPDGRHVVTLAGAELPYRILFDQMNEGAVTLTLDGVIVHCNRRFAEMVRLPVPRVIGASLRRFVVAAERATLEALQRDGSVANARSDLTLRAGDRSLVPVEASFAPLHAEGNTAVIGVVAVIRDTSERRRAEAQRIRLVEQVMTAQEEERRRIARELHDETGQSLTALLVGLRTIEGSETIAQAVELAQRLRETTAQTLVDVGRLWRGLHPGILDDVGLATAVTRHAAEFSRLHGIVLEVDTEELDDRHLSQLLKATIYRLLQEALTNVAQHARARSASVRIGLHAGMVELRVRDDGAGFTVNPDGQLGLRGMRERATLLGGSVEVVSQPGSGTTIRAHFPAHAGRSGS